MSAREFDASCRLRSRKWRGDLVKVVRTDLIACFVCALVPVLRWKLHLHSFMCVDGVTFWVLGLLALTFH